MPRRMIQRVLLASAELQAERDELRVLSGEMDGLIFDPFSGEWVRESKEDVEGDAPPSPVRRRSRSLWQRRGPVSASGNPSGRSRQKSGRLKFWRPPEIARSRGA